MADYYAILGVERGVDEAALRSAYRKLAMKHHPDRHKGDAEAEKKFKQINEAYAVLKDPQKRAAYDRYGSEGLKGGARGGTRGGAAGFGGGFGGGGFEVNIGDFFNQAFGGGRPRGRGADLSCDITISLEEAFKGTERTITRRARVTCGICKGSGLAPGATPEQCRQCNGSGKSRFQQGHFIIEQTCDACGGEGKMIKNPCQTCKGSGVVMQTSKVNVTIPKGSEPNMRIRLERQGEGGQRGAPSGDLYVMVRIKPHEFFKRSGADLLFDVPIPMTLATLGGKVEVFTIEGGKTTLDIPEGTQPNERLRLSAMGMPFLNNPHRRGDAIATVVVETPTKLTGEQKQLLERFAASGGAEMSHSPRSKSFLQRLKELINA